MGEATGGDPSSGTLAKVKAKETERRRYDLTGSIPQWIAAALLTIIGALLLLIWNSTDRRIGELEKRMQEIAATVESKSTLSIADIATLKLHATMTDQICGELRAGQSQTATLVTQAVTELKFLSSRLMENRQK
jgi:HAMP domain-containing protein